MTTALTTKVENRRLPVKAGVANSRKKGNGHLTNEEVKELKAVCGFLRHGRDGKRIQVDSTIKAFMGYCYCSGNGTMRTCITGIRDDYYDCKYYPKSTRIYLPVPYKPTQTFKKEFCLK